MGVTTTARPPAGPADRAPAERGRLARTVRRRTLGVAFLAVLVSLLGLSVAAYEKVFTPTVPVTLLTDHVGNQLQPQSDVTMRGIVVGSVRRVTSHGKGARVSLALDPHRVGLIPRDVTARLLPKTLFGERYVSLVPPPAGVPGPSGPSAGSGPSGGPGTGDHLRAHDVIGQDRSSSAIELEKVFSDVFPLLRTLRPVQLNATLHALATALSGRGRQIGQTLDDLDAYLRAITPSLPDIEHDIQALASTAEVYRSAAPDLLHVLSNLRTTSRTVVERGDSLAALLRTTTTLATTGHDVLQEDSQRLISVASTNRPVLELLARYAPEYPCLLEGLTEQEPLLEQAFGGGQPGLNLTLEVTRGRGKYVPGDEPRYLAHSGPDCHGLPAHPAGTFDPGPHIPDGSAPVGPPGLLGSPVPGLGSADMGVQGSAAERQLVDALVAPTLGVSPDEVPDVADVLFAPMARGTEVDIR